MMSRCSLLEVWTTNLARKGQDPDLRLKNHIIQRVKGYRTFFRTGFQNIDMSVTCNESTFGECCFVAISSWSEDVSARVFSIVGDYVSCSARWIWSLQCEFLASEVGRKGPSSGSEVCEVFSLVRVCHPSLKPGPIPYQRTT